MQYTKLILLLILLPILVWVPSPAVAVDGYLSTAANPFSPDFSPNLVINGNMNIWQRGTTFTSIASGTYAADRFRTTIVSTAVADVTRSTDVPTVAQSGQLFSYSYGHTVTTADAAIAAGDAYLISQHIEGYDWAPYAQRPVTLSFWVRDTVTGEHAVAIQNTAQNRSFVATYMVNVTNTWEKKVITFPASPSAGTWDYTTGIGLRLGFVLLVGSTFQTTPWAWQTSNVFGTATTVNSVGTIGNIFRITGIKIELGSIASPIQPLTFAEELAQCQRYYQKSFLYATAPAQNVGVGTGELTFPALQAGATAQRSQITTFPVRMRLAPTMTTYNPAAANGQIRDETAAGDLTAVATVATEQGFHVTGTGNAGTAIANLLGVHWQAVSEP